MFFIAYMCVGKVLKVLSKCLSCLDEEIRINSAIFILQTISVIEM